MIDTFYLVEIIGIDGTLIGVEKFIAIEYATAFIDNYSESSSYCNLFEARQIDY